VQISHHIQTTRMELWDFIKSSALYLLVHMELGLCQSFYLSRSLGAYTVGSTKGFAVEIMEALALQSHHQIPWKCPQYHMSTCSAHRRVIGSGHLLNGGLRGYYRCNVHWVPWTTGYSPKL
jgi:hypothetical protein